jgi:hypothetical protein
MVDATDVALACARGFAFGSLFFESLNLNASSSVAVFTAMIFSSTELAGLVERRVLSTDGARRGRCSSFS